MYCSNGRIVWSALSVLRRCVLKCTGIRSGVPEGMRFQRSRLGTIQNRFARRVDEKKERVGVRQSRETIVR